MKTCCGSLAFPSQTDWIDVAWVGHSIDVNGKTASPGMKRCPLQYLISEKHAHQLSAEPIFFFSELTFYRPGSPQTLW